MSGKNVNTPKTKHDVHSWSQQAQYPQCAQQAQYPQCPHQREYPCDIIAPGIPQPNFLSAWVFHHKAREGDSNRFILEQQFHDGCHHLK